MKQKNKRIVLAYSGGVDTSVCIPWLKDRGYEVVAMLVDVGQPTNLSAHRNRARKLGAQKSVVRDLKREFVRDFVFPALKANAVYESQYLLATALSRPLIAKALVETAHEENAAGVAHGCTGKGNDQVRFEVTVQLLDPHLEIIAPVREWDFKSREEEIEFLNKRGFSIGVSRKNPYSIDENLWGVSIECGELEDPWRAPPAQAYQWTRGAEKRHLKDKTIEIAFQQGVPVRVNGKKKEPRTLIAELNRISALYGIGRSDVIENRLVGIKSREVYEAPAASVLLAAHRDLESLVLDRETLHFKEILTRKYAELIYNGLWFTPLKKSIDQFVNDTQKRVTGSVKGILSNRHFTVSARKSPYSRYQHRLATYSKEDQFDQSLAKGFIDIWAMPYKENR